MLDPFSYPFEWDIVRIAGVTCPGYCKIDGFTRPYGWDVKKGKGTLGAVVTFVSSDPAKGSITFYLWTKDHFDRWLSFRKLFAYDPTKKKLEAVDIYHSSLEDIGIKSVVIESIGMIVRESGGLYSIKVDMLEYFPPPKKSAVATPSGSSTNGGKKTGSTPGTKPDPIEDAQQAEIGRLLVEARKP